ncbi:hypothetical protein N658DRAFT_198242 [Parathielavia hyrcaniae]|uniref:Uncharacterized protein n=1 Tax=Parathielavia hyrcaniae TaxID=113614 RepID=A0AAN6T5R6_9PEZI|nr:hypothetical protein N658DRAFT_198242 [Parathielavia hyrcaniae]
MLQLPPGDIDSPSGSPLCHTRQGQQGGDQTARLASAMATTRDSWMNHPGQPGYRRIYEGSWKLREYKVSSVAALDFAAVRIPFPCLDSPPPSPNPKLHRFLVQQGPDRASLPPCPEPILEHRSVTAVSLFNQRLGRRESDTGVTIKSRRPSTRDSNSGAPDTATHLPV